MPPRDRRSSGLWLSPFAVTLAIVGATSLFAAPVGYWLDGYGYFDYFKRGLSDAAIWQAFYWTLYAWLALGLAYFMLGIHTQFRAFQQRPAVYWSQSSYRRLWALVAATTVVAVAAMWVQAGGVVPILAGAGTDYLEYTRLRSDFAGRINPGLFNVTLYLLATPQLVIGWFCLRQNRLLFRLLSSAVFVLVALFTLERSAVAMAVFIVLNYRLLLRPVMFRHIAIAAGATAALLVAVHFLAGEPAGYQSRLHYLAVRLVYGQWMAVPHFFERFANHPEPLAAILPGPLQHLLGVDFVAPARLVMQNLAAPASIEDGRAVAASGFFIGDAYAVAGATGVLVAPLVVCCQLWLAAFSLRLLPVNFFTRYLCAWFFFKLLVGLGTGFSAFVLSSLQAGILVLAYVALTRALGIRTLRRGGSRVAHGAAQA